MSSTTGVISDVAIPDIVVPLSQAAVIARLRAQVGALEERRSDPVCPVPPALAALLPGGGLKPGGVYCLESESLLASLLATPSREGSWCGVVGLQGLGVEAAVLAGVRIDRLVLVPEPGPRWLSVVAALCAAMPVVVVRPPETVRAGDAARLAARLRDHGTVLFAMGDWPGAEATITVDEPCWTGLGDGWGYLASREVSISVTSKRHPWPKSVRALLPGVDGTLEAVPSAMPARETTQKVAA